MLRALEEEGILERQTFPEVPPRVEYGLTEKGRALIPIVEAMRAYGEEWLDATGSRGELTEDPAAAALLALQPDPHAASALPLARAPDGPA